MSSKKKIMSIKHNINYLDSERSNNKNNINNKNNSNKNY